MLIRIEEAGDEDAAAIATLWTEAFHGPAAGMRAQPYELADVERARADGIVFIARDGEALAGAVVLYLPGSAPQRGVAEPEEAELTRLAVTRRFRRRGVGWALASRCIDSALEAEAAGIVLWSRPHQAAAHALYERLDFLRAPGRDTADDDGPKLVFHIDLR
ncbi:MAG: GNAT family N-acetyltransferase [Solirubrobacterales bacterium]